MPVFILELVFRVHLEKLFAQLLFPTWQVFILPVSVVSEIIDQNKVILSRVLTNSIDLPDQWQLVANGIAPGTVCV